MFAHVIFSILVVALAAGTIAWVVDEVTKRRR